jgi:hypothetical protein
VRGECWREAGFPVARYRQRSCLQPGLRTEYGLPLVAGPRDMLTLAVRPHGRREIGWLAFCSGSRPCRANLQARPTLSAAVPNWSVGDTIHLGGRTLRLVGHRDDDADQPPVLVVEEVGLDSAA